jgi:hypothetical protein
MTLFCTNCGAAVSADTRFCTACGAGREISESPPPGAADIAAKKNRRAWPWWVLVVIAFFLLGLWLGRGPAAKKPLCAAPATVEGGAGKLIQGPGKPLKVGRGGPGDPPDFAGSGGHVKVPRGNGLDGPGVDGDDDDAGGGGGGKGPSSDTGEATPPTNGGGDELKNDLRRFTQGKGPPNSGQADDQDAKALPQGKSYSANDFTYDKTNLPRYPDAVSAVVSSISYEPESTDTYSTGAGIVTASSFDTVVSWYRQNLPPGWHDMTIGDMQQLSKQLSVQSITQMLGAQPASDPAAAGAASSAAAPTAAADQIRISVFSPPAGSKAKSGVMIVQHGDSPVEALLQAKVAPSS